VRKSFVARTSATLATTFLQQNIADTYEQDKEKDERAAAACTNNQTPGSLYPAVR
jgi:hypothetical protein